MTRVASLATTRTAADQRSWPSNSIRKARDPTEISCSTIGVAPTATPLRNTCAPSGDELTTREPRYSAAGCCCCGIEGSGSGTLAAVLFVATASRFLTGATAAPMGGNWLDAVDAAVFTPPGASRGCVGSGELNLGAGAVTPIGAFGLRLGAGSVSMTTAVTPRATTQTRMAPAPRSVLPHLYTCPLAAFCSQEKAGSSSSAGGSRGEGSLHPSTSDGNASRSAGTFVVVSISAGPAEALKGPPHQGL